MYDVTHKIIRTTKSFISSYLLSLTNTTKMYCLLLKSMNIKREPVFIIALSYPPTTAQKIDKVFVKKMHIPLLKPSNFPKR